MKRFFQVLRAYIANEEPPPTAEEKALLDLLKYSLGQDLMDKANGVLEWESDSYYTGVLRRILGEEIYHKLKKEVYP